MELYNNYIEYVAIDRYTDSHFTVRDACNSQDIIQSAVSRGLTGAAVQGTGS